VTDDPQRRCPDIALARARLDWAPTVSYTDGLAATLHWFRTGSGEHAYTQAGGR
jgi:dTDP-glucose 4,6-dehydratase